jgi:hypothetical protein
MGATATLTARSASVTGTSAAPTDGSTLTLAAQAATSTPPLPCLESTGFPAWWTSSSPKSSSAGYVYFDLGRAFSLCKI